MLSYRQTKNLLSSMFIFNELFLYLYLAGCGNGGMFKHLNEKEVQKQFPHDKPTHSNAIDVFNFDRDRFMKFSLTFKFWTCVAFHLPRIH